MDIKKHFEFSPNKSLIQLRVLWIVVGIISLISTICFILIYKNSNIITDITYHGFNMFIVIYRVPLSILALIIPIIALLAANHRSEQTREQIRLANDQNNFSNYYKHIEEFEKYSSKISAENKIEFKSTRKLYKKLFPNARNGDFKIKYSFMEYNGEKLKKYMGLTKKLTLSDSNTRNECLYEMDNILKNILDELLIKDLPHHNMSITFDHLGKPILIPNKDYKEFVLQFVIIIRLFDELCNFDLDYKREDYLNIILNYDFNSIDQNEVYNLSTPVNSDLNLSHFNDKNDIS